MRAPATVIWGGNPNSLWDLSLSSNWNYAGTQEVYVDGDDVIFDLTSSTRNINLTEDISPSSMTINDGAYVFSGEGTLNGDMTLSVSNRANVTITNRNAFTGKVVVDNANLTLSHTPSPTGNGGIGKANVADPSLFV